MCIAESTFVDRFVQGQSIFLSICLVCEIICKIYACSEGRGQMLAKNLQEYMNVLLCKAIILFW